jgi:hypothetical protein
MLTVKVVELAVSIRLHLHYSHLFAVTDSKSFCKQQLKQFVSQAASSSFAAVSGCRSKGMNVENNNRTGLISFDFQAVTFLSYFFQLRSEFVPH